MYHRPQESQPLEKRDSGASKHFDLLHSARRNIKRGQDRWANQTPSISLFSSKNRYWGTTRFVEAGAPSSPPRAVIVRAMARTEPTRELTCVRQGDAAKVGAHATTTNHSGLTTRSESGCGSLSEFRSTLLVQFLHPSGAK